MEYFASHPTEFKNVIYRSRLEAKWASFFTDLGWEFQYEPFDLKGWVPDFEIITKTDKRLLVEVKPVSYFGETMDNCDFSYEESFAKAINYSNEFDILLLGIGPLKIEWGISIGVIVTKFEFDWMFFKQGYDISSYLLDWDGIIYRNNSVRKSFLSWENHPEIEGFWADAHNNTKFNAFKYCNDSNCAGS